MTRKSYTLQALSPYANNSVSSDYAHDGFEMGGQTVSSDTEI